MFPKKEKEKEKIRVLGLPQPGSCGDNDPACRVVMQQLHALARLIQPSLFSVDKARACGWGRDRGPASNLDTNGIRLTS